MSKSKAKKIVDTSLEERRERQFRVLKMYGAGKITPNQAIDTIVDMEKIVYIGNMFKAKQKKIETGDKNGR